MEFRPKIRAVIKSLLPPVLVPLAQHVAASHLPGAPGYHGNYDSWDAAVAMAGGYDAANILEIQRASMRKVRDGLAVYERDSVLFDQIEYFFPTLAALLLAGSRNANRLNVLDFGGALGSTYYQNRALLSHLSPFHWNVVEQRHFVDAGKAEFQNSQLRFYNSIDQSWAAAVPDVVLLSSVLQYLDQPMALLKDIEKRTPRYILVDRTPVLDYGAERIVVQTVPPSIYPASYACRLFAPGTIEAALGDSYDLLYAFEAHVGTIIDVGNARARYRGYFFQSRNPESR